MIGKDNQYGYCESIAVETQQIPCRVLPASEYSASCSVVETHDDQNSALGKRRYGITPAIDGSSWYP